MTAFDLNDEWLISNEPNVCEATLLAEMSVIFPLAHLCRAVAGSRVSEFALETFDLSISPNSTSVNSDDPDAVAIDIADYEKTAARRVNGSSGRFGSRSRHINRLAMNGEFVDDR